MLGVGIYGLYGHQIQKQLMDHPRAQLVAAAGCERERLEATAGRSLDVPVYDSLAEMLDDERVQLVSLSSPRRADQAEQALACIAAGRHVYAEKPCAMSEADLDRIVDAAERAGVRFHEMAGTAFVQPYAAMRKAVHDGQIGEVVQVLAQKSYPYHDGRPQDETIDGGLVVQAGVHAARMVEHVAGVRVEAVLAIDTQLGNPHPDGELRMAASMVLRLANGGVATINANYLNPRDATGIHGHESLQIFGTEGIVEARMRDKHTGLFVGNQDLSPLDVTTDPGRNYFEYVLDEVLNDKPMPVDLATELHPTRIVLRARASAQANGQWQSG